MKIAFIFSTIIALTYAVHPTPVNNLNLTDISGTWYVNYVSPIPAVPGSFINCLGFENKIQNETIVFTFFTDILGKKVNETINIIPTSNNTIWITPEGNRLVLFSFDSENHQYGALGDQVKNFFFIFSRNTTLSQDITSQVATIAFNEGYSNTFSIVPGNGMCGSLKNSKEPQFLGKALDFDFIDLLKGDEEKVEQISL